MVETNRSSPAWRGPWGHGSSKTALVVDSRFEPLMSSVTLAECVLAMVDQLSAQYAGTFGEVTLEPDVVRSPLGGLDRQRYKPNCRQIVRTRPHVEGPDLLRQLETVTDQLAGNQRRQLVRPPVDIHIRVQARRLVMLVLGLPCRLKYVQRPRSRREEPESVKMAAPNSDLVHDRGGSLRVEAQRQGAVTRLGRRLPVDHRPLVHPEATEMRRPRSSGHEQAINPLNRFTATHQNRGNVEPHSATSIADI